ncbi:hypothetical protein AB0I84_47940 [Streptomyces spectabilis]|uniref:hypothetical protein n=1 Tax=Streptomyces spectabilis TaxID=68270 RepID=UPI0033C8D6FE
MPETTPLVRLYDVPDATALTTVQCSGAVCVWCLRALHPGEGIDLGGTDTWRPHGCVPCCHLHNRDVTTYIDWYDHGIECQWCPLGPCEQARTLREAHLQARQRAGKTAPPCLNCRTVIAPGAPIRPHLWQGAYGPVRSYFHARDCPAVRVL